MRILLDTHILLWAAADKLPPIAVSYIGDKANTLLFSSASIWEITIKSELGRTDFSVDPVALYNGLLGAGYEELTVTSRHSLNVVRTRKRNPVGNKGKQTYNHNGAVVQIECNG